MYGDTGVMLRRASQLREQGSHLQRQADQLVAQMEAIAWSGRASTAMRERVRERAAALREVARGHEAAADSLERHLRQVEDRKMQIATTQRRAEDAGVEHPPPSGHRDWLDLPER